MTLGELEQELRLIVQDSSLQSYFNTWINLAIQELAADFDLPALKCIEPWPLSVNTGDWIYNLPENYQRKLFRCVDVNYSPITICSTVEDIHRLDIDHDETGDLVTHVATMDAVIPKKIFVYPKADTTIYLWYYQIPSYIEDSSDVPTCIPAEYHGRVLIPRVVIKNFQLLQDLIIDAPHRSLAYWRGLESEGLYGSPRGPIGLIHWIVRSEGSPRRHGGRDPLP